MASSSKKVRYHKILQRDLQYDDNQWAYNLIPPNLRHIQYTRNDTEDGGGQKIAIMSIIVKHESITLTVEQQQINRVLSASKESPEEIIAISFANFNFPDLLPKMTSDYIERLLTKGIILNGHKYIFYGHSNSQLKSRTCYLLRASNEDAVMNRIRGFGDFSNFMSVAKRAKRIGLLFSAADACVQLDKRYTMDIDDVESDGHVFTDGCGMISKEFANELARRRKMTFQNTRYYPSAFQIRYKGYKGMLMVNPNLNKENKARLSKEQSQPIQPKIQFRASMRKFKDCPDNSFSILEYSKPFTYGFLNGELVTLLSCLGIADQVFLKKQEDYFKFLEDSSTSTKNAFKYLCYKGDPQAAEDVLLGGLTDNIIAKIKRLAREEWTGTYKKNDPKEGNERVRIMIPDSRILYGVCDYAGTLKEGEVHVRITTEAEGQRTIDGGHVIVSRNPCLHPGDIRKFVPVKNDLLSHLVDCIVFPIIGRRDAASQMSGGDLDGDKFFVSWDKDIIPSRLYEPYGSPPAKETPRRTIDYKSMVQYFAKYNNSSLGRVKNLFLDWCRANPTDGPGSKECQQLNALFSSCVDGEKIKIPEQLENPPKPKEGSAPAFILDILCRNVKKKAETVFRTEPAFVDLTPLEVIEEIFSSPHMPSVLDEYRLFLMALRWCERNHSSLELFIHFFDFGSFTTPQKHMVLSSLASTKNNKDLCKLYIGKIFNGLHQSELLSLVELRSANMHHPEVRWQKLYSSYDDGGLRLAANLERAFEYFDKKMIVFNVDENLKLAIFIPKRVDKFSEIDVGDYKDFVKLFAFEPQSGNTHKKEAVKGYRLFFDGEIIRIYEKRRPNTFVWFALNEFFALRNGIQSSGEFKVSIALQKFNYRLSKSQPRINKKASCGIEIYVISNRDRVGHQILENTMNSVETTDIRRILANIPKEYNILTATESDWSQKPEYFEEIIVRGNLEKLSTLQTTHQVNEIVQFCLEKNHGKLFQILNYIFTNLDGFASRFGHGNYHQLKSLILSLPEKLPSLSIVIAQEFTTGQAGSTLSLFNSSLEEVGNMRLHSYSLASALILSTNEFHESTLKQFKELLGLMRRTPPENESFELPELTKLTKLIMYSIRDTKLAQEFLAELFEDEIEHSDTETRRRSNSQISTDSGLSFGSNTNGNGSCYKYFTHFLHALALDYLAEVGENCPCDFWGLPIGAEEQNVQTPIKPLRNHLEKLSTIQEFLPEKLTGEIQSTSANVSRRLDFVAPEPHQKCLEITPSSTVSGAFETELRIDVISKIQNEDHLRFCASQRSGNQPKTRITAFDAIAISLVSGKLTFRILQKPVPRELLDASWNVYICGSTTNFNTMVTALYNLVELQEEATVAFHDVLEILHGSTTTTVNPNLEIDVLISNNFNASQITAVRAALNSPLTLIWGPPGSGKTTVVVEIILNFMRIHPGLRILVSASTHNAVDNVMERFLKERGELGDSNSEDVVRLTSDFGKVSPSLKRWTLDAFVGADLHASDKAKGAAGKKLKGAAIVFTTCSGAGVGLLRAADEETSLWPKEMTADAKKKANKKKIEGQFDIVIVDEASQITEPNALIPITKASKYVILVGDHVQLRPTVAGESAKALGLETSLFEKLYLSKLTHAKKIMLDTQYRMHPNLCRFSSDQFYDSKLLSGESAEDRILPKSLFPWPEGFPFVFINCKTSEDFGSISKCNRGQAEMTVRVVQMLRSCDDQSASSCKIIILTPYTKQVAMIKGELKSGGTGAVEVNTIDGFQGREADIIIFVTVRANRSQSLGFLDDKRRMNVAVTRARLGLIVIGEEETLKGDKLWNAMMSYAKMVDLLTSNKQVGTRKP